jgi:hypothetical protein
MIHIGDVNVERGILSCIVYLPKMDIVMYVWWCREVGYCGNARDARGLVLFRCRK